MKKAFTILVIFTNMASCTSQINDFSLGFVLSSGDTLIFYLDEMEIIDNKKIALVSESKLNRVKNVGISEAFLLNVNEENLAIELFYIFSSRVPNNKLYIFTIRENELKLYKDCQLSCSQELFKLITDAMNSSSSKR
ncbi:MAG: hypothetical protein JJU02_04760 [Cryomorphaceae bacterium]|nr:hypothetical protein [Cryomorphaceae bacterium]